MRDQLEISGLQTQFDTRDGLVRAVDGVDLVIPAGKTVCLVGESGCGKSITARSVLGLVDPPGKVAGGQVWWNGTDLTALDPKGAELRRIRGQEIAMVFQESVSALSPMYTVGAQLGEILMLHRGLSKIEARAESIKLLQRVGIPKPERRIDSYSWQLSGGMCQRVMIAMALSCGPSLLIADEPTTALDVTIQARILDLFADLQAESQMSMLFITHDLGVVAEIADEVAVMYLGRIVEQASVGELFADPQHPYTRALLGSIPKVGTGQGQRLATIRGQVPHGAKRPTGCSYHPRCDVAMAGLCDQTEPRTVIEDGHLVQCHLMDRSLSKETRSLSSSKGQPLRVIERPSTGSGSGSVESGGGPLLEVRDLSVRFPVKGGMFGRHQGDVHAVTDASLAIHPGETLGLVGESGCGKTTLGRCIVRSIAPSEGQISYRTEGGETLDAAGLSRRTLRAYQKEVRMIFQDPFSSLNPRMTLRQIIGDPLTAHGIARGDELTDRVAQMMRRVGLSPDYMDRYPHAFSGGQRQRVNIARALILEPRLVVADEAVSALDVSVRAQILNLLKDLQEEYQLTYLFISHDLSVVESICDRVAVMYLGKVAELAETQQVFRSPAHPYTEALLSAVPIPDPKLRDSGRRIRLSDDLPDPINPPDGCYFHTRCSYAQEGLCDSAENPPELTGAHLAACLRRDELSLTPVSGAVR